jgi:hypothetical protein
MKRRIFLKKSTVAATAAVTQLQALWSPARAEESAAPTMGPTYWENFTFIIHSANWTYDPLSISVSVPTLSVDVHTLGPFEATATFSLPTESLASISLSDPFQEEFYTEPECSIVHQTLAEWEDPTLFTISVTGVDLSILSIELADISFSLGSLSVEPSEELEIWWA